MVNVLGLVFGQQDVAEHLGRLSAAEPGTLGDVVAQQLNLVAESTPGSWLTDTVLVVVALWTISTAVHHLVRGIRTAAGAQAGSSVAVRLLAVGVAFIAVLSLGLAAYLIDMASVGGTIVATAASLVVLTAALAQAYRASLGRRVRGLWRAAAAAAVALMVVALALSVYGSVSANLHLIYGASAGAIVSMLGLWLAVLAVLVGAAWLGQRREPSTPEPSTPES